MSVKDEEVEEPVVTLKQKCVKCLKGPNLLKTLVIFGCTVIVAQQIVTCVRKLIDSPITTYTHFDFNKTMAYPSLTFCREPPYKYGNMMEYGLYSHPRFTSTWRNFNYSIPLDQLWENITYTDEDYFVQYGLNGEVSNIKVIPTLGFVTGRCYTLEPTAPAPLASRASGYSVTLQHHADDILTSTSVYPPGYHVYVHYKREPFTEVEVYNGGLFDYFYINTGDTMDVKLSVNQYHMINQAGDPCNDVDEYSTNDCTTQLVWNQVAEEVGCSGPWMKSVFPHCDNFTSMRNLIAVYMNTYHNHSNAHCPRFCSSYLYKAFINDRQKYYFWDSSRNLWALRAGEAELQSQLYVYFNSMMVSVYEERYNYDWNLFISDLGGSIGFLLGLSVIGLMTIVTKIWMTIIRPCIRTPKVKKANSTSSIITAKLEKDQSSEVFKKCNDWSQKNASNYI